MRRRRSLLVAVAVVILLALASFAQAQGTTAVLLFSGSGGKIVSETGVQLRAEGQILVSFHGDGGTGCATYGVCPYSGTIVVRPRTGVFEVTTYRLHGRIERQAFVLLESLPSQYATVARVERSIPGAPPAVCADAGATSLSSPSTSTHAGAVTIRLFSARGNTLSTRCAGPLDGDLAGVAPIVTLPLKRLARGHTTVNLSGTASFASHGFAGTVSSTLALVLGKPSTHGPTVEFPPGIKTTRTRTVTERLTLTRITGDLRARIRGVANATVCQMLDSCGMVGTLGFGKVATQFTGEALAMGPARRPYRDFLAALGLSAGNPGGISLELDGSFVLAPATAFMTQPGEKCTDSAPGSDMYFTLARSHGELRGFASASSGRTRCPGPALGAQNGPLLEAALPLHAIAGRTFTIGLRPAKTIEDDGYMVAARGHLALVLRRGQISQQVNVVPTGSTTTVGSTTGG